jgi:FKBP-type peptidyl-prolyl cis-trans isomerase
MELTHEPGLHLLQGVAQMAVGERAKLLCSPEVAYGERGAGEIAPNSPLIFLVELIQIRST